MEPSTLSVPSSRTSAIPSAHRCVYSKLLSFCSRRAAQQRFDSSLNSIRWLKCSNTSVTQPLKPLSIPLQVYAATLEGDTIADNGAVTAWNIKNGILLHTDARDSGNGRTFQTVEEMSEDGKALQFSQKESDKIEPSRQGSNSNYEPRSFSRYADRVGENIVVPLDALKPGAIFTGKVTNIVAFGAFVDIGAFTSGLIHISNIANRYVVINDILKVGDEVEVMVITVDPRNRRLSLKLIREDEEPKVGKLPPPSNSSHAREKRSMVNNTRDTLNVPAGRPQKGEVITGSIAKIYSSGVAVTLNQGHKGFLPANEVLSSGESVETTSYFRLGQQLPVRVLRTTRDKIILTMRKQENTAANSEVDSIGTVVSSEEGRATSPFEIAFRRDKVIGKFLEERERLKNLAKENVDEHSVEESA